MGQKRNQQGNLKISWRQKHNIPKPVGCSKSSFQREVDRHTHLLFKNKERAQVNNPTLYLKGLVKNKLRQS